MDGTTNFAHHIPWYAISIALQVEDTLRVGLVLAPESRWELSAVRGGGARLNDHPTRVSEAEEIRCSLLGTGFPYEREDFDNVEHVKNALHSAQGVRRMGTASLQEQTITIEGGDFSIGGYGYQARLWSMEFIPSQPTGISGVIIYGFSPESTGGGGFGPRCRCR